MTDWRRPQCQALEANLLAYWLIGVTEEIKSPATAGALVVRLGPQVTSVPQQLPLNTRLGNT